ncbi:MAG TPA: DNA polymerase III subunit delta [Firmicutes bacterium]|nr:DNA polymerase III subunit delta [Bacillota bacterium]
MNLYTIIGEQTVLCEKRIQDILNEHEIKPFDLMTYDMRETAIQEAMFDVQTVPFLSPKKAILVRHPYFLSGKDAKSDVTHDLDVLTNYLNNPNSENILIFYAPYEKLDERKKIVKLLKQKSEVSTFEVYNKAALTAWLKKKLKEENITFDQTAIDLFLNLTHEKLDLLHKELEKISLYFMGETLNRHLDKDLVNLLVARQLEDNVFQLTDAILNKKVFEAYRIYQDLLTQNEEPFKILILIANQFRLMSQVMTLSSAGYREAEMAKTLDVHPYRVKLMLEHSYKFNLGLIKQYLSQLADIDYKIKSGELKKELALEMFILNI